MFDLQDSAEEKVRTLSREEAAVVKALNPPLSPWRVVAWQAMMVLLLMLLALAVTQKLAIVYSLAWGGLCVVIPSAVFARGLMSQTTLMNAGSATTGFFLWEVVKIGLTLAMLFAAPRVMQILRQDLSWLALLVGLIVTMKVYWLALLCKPKVR
ncbi:MAG: ATP synthase subunit I [Cytophagales bacterium]|nr:ATP synthase subunit I [Cytophagales bacterium]